MSAIGGIFNFDKGPVDDDLVSVLASQLAKRGPDGGDNVSLDSLAVVYRAFNTTPESHYEKQPLRSSRGQILCWDGRLDNREELITNLGEELRGDRSDAGIVMAAYLKWGFDCLSRIIGTFALSVWEPESRSLLLARDIIGAHDLYYQRNEKRVIWASDLRVLLDLAEIDLEVDEEYIAAYLTRLPDPWQTPFKNLEAVPPAHAVVFTENSVVLRRFWALNPKHEIRYKTDVEYEEHFRHLFTQAVKCCLRSDRPVWSDLSGGLDSSSIVCMADHLIKNGEAQAPMLETVSSIRDESKSSNELKFIRPVEERIGKQGHHVPESRFPILSSHRTESSIIPNVLDIFGAYHEEVSRLMDESGARVRLCGNGGDEILNSSPDPGAELGDLLVAGNMLGLHRRLRTWSLQQKKPYIKLFWEDALQPMLPRKLRVVLRAGPIKRLPAWLNPEFVKRMDLRDRMLGPDDVYGFRWPSQRMQAIGFLSAAKEVAAGYCRVFQNTEIRLPLLHQPLIEFMQAIPAEQRTRPGETRSLQRRALRDLLPVEILKRKGKGNPIEAIFRAGCREYPRLHSVLSDSYAARFGYVNQTALMASFKRLRHGDKRAMEVFRIIPLEFWLRSLERLRIAGQNRCRCSGSNGSATGSGMTRAFSAP